MKLTLTALVLFFVIQLTAQNTTQVEYNYMKTGYKTTEESGLDVKKGYEVTELSEQNFTNVSIIGITLKRSADQSLAGTILKVKEKALLGGTNLYYYAIPAPSTKDGISYGWAQFSKDIDQMSGYQKSAVIQWISYQYGYNLVMYTKTK